MERESRTRLATIGVLALVFVAGGAVGAALQRVLAPEPGAAVAGGAVGDRREREDGRRERRRIVDRVGLTEEQRAKVDSIVEYHRVRVGEVWREMGPRFEAIAESTRADIKRILTPEQRARYDSLLAEYHRRRSERSGPGEHRGREGGR